jgi:lysozyme
MPNGKGYRMTVNQATIDLIKRWEGYKAQTYIDPVGIATIGYGTTAAAGVGIVPVMGQTITEAQATGYLIKGVEKFAAQIRPHIKQPINENEFGAFVSLAYNIGPGAFIRSTALRRFNEGDKAGAADALLMWNKGTVGGKKVVLRGLERRREAERALFLKPVTAPKERPIAASTTLQASGGQIAAGAGVAATSVGYLDGTAQLVVVALAGVIILGALWVMRERIRHWAEGVK